jgi:hypothetical protein
MNIVLVGMVIEEGWVVLVLLLLAVVGVLVHA